MKRFFILEKAVSNEKRVSCTSTVLVLHVRFCHAKMKAQYKKLHKFLYQAKEKAVCKLT